MSVAPPHFERPATSELVAGRAALERRLREYQLKYSVYDDIVVLSPGGEVLAK